MNRRLRQWWWQLGYLPRAHWPAITWSLCAGLAYDVHIVCLSRAQQAQERTQRALIEESKGSQWNAKNNGANGPWWN